MPKFKFSPGHSSGFKELGIFEMDQSEIDSVDLIEKAIERGEIAIVFFLLSQQVRNDTNKLDLIDYELDRLVDDSKTIEDRDSLGLVERDLNGVLDLLFGITNQTVSSVDCCKEIKNRIINSGDPKKIYTSEAEKNKRILDEDCDNFSNLVSEKERGFVGRVAVISEGIEIAKSKFSDPDQV